MPAPTISRVRPLFAERGLGTTLVEALFSDNQTVRFRVLSRDPAAVRAIADEGLPEHDRVVEASIDGAQRRRDRHGDLQRSAHRAAGPSNLRSSFGVRAG